MNQILPNFSSTTQMFNDEHQVLIAHSVFKQSVYNVIAHQLQQPSIEIC